MFEDLAALWTDYLAAKALLHSDYARGTMTREEYKKVGDAFYAFTVAKEMIIKLEYGACQKA